MQSMAEADVVGRCCREQPVALVACLFGKLDISPGIEFLRPLVHGGIEMLVLQNSYHAALGDLRPVMESHIGLGPAA